MKRSWQSKLAAWWAEGTATWCELLAVAGPEKAKDIIAGELANKSVPHISYLDTQPKGRG